MSDEGLPHLRIERTDRETLRRSGGNPRPKRPQDLVAHARRLQDDVTHIQGSPLPVAGFDSRRLLKLEVTFGDPRDLERIPGLTVVSQEGRTLTVLFASRAGLETFRRYLQDLERTGKAKYAQMLWTITSVAEWTASDRKGRALAREGLPEDAEVVLDVELWPLDLLPDRQAMVRSFHEWCRESNVQILDGLEAVTIVVFRIRASRTKLDDLLGHRDVRVVDLPPRFGFDFRLLSTTRETIGHVPPPPATAPKIAVLDTGVVGAHPLVAPALGEARSFVTNARADDEHGHGTHVCGLALYGDVEACIREGFAPRLWLLSGRISDPGPDNRSDSELLEKRIERAVEHFVKRHGCRVFVSTFCDARRPYADGHVDRFAAFIDELATRYGVLFVVPTGNFLGDTDGHRWSDYPKYLIGDSTRLLDPAPAINALTVGSLARNEQSRLAQRYPNDPRQVPVARRDQPSPFSRRGPGPRGATKPEIAAYGGNYSIDRTGGGERLTNRRDLGELSLNREFAGGNLFLLDAGTSQAAPQVGHVAARILERLPQATPNLLRALVVAHAEVPSASQGLVTNEQLRDLVGWGRPRLVESMVSNERRVTMWSEAEIARDACQFYEIPIPADFLRKPQRRARRITVCLSHMPLVRRTRFDYRSCRVDFRIVRGTDKDEVATVFRRADKDEDGLDILKEPSGVTPGTAIRGKSTVQRATWLVKQTDSTWHSKPPFIVVTSRPPVWGRDAVPERYAMVVVVEDLSSEDVRLHSQARAILEQHVRLRNRR